MRSMGIHPFPGKCFLCERMESPRRASLMGNAQCIYTATPPLSGSVVAMAISQSPNKLLTVNKICDYIQKLPYYRKRWPAWQHSIRHWGDKEGATQQPRCLLQDDYCHLNPLVALITSSTKIFFDGTQPTFYVSESGPPKGGDSVVRWT